MENGQNTKKVKGSGRKADTLDDSTKSKNSESMPLGEFENSSPLPIAATTRKGSKKIWTSAELAELRSKIGLVAGALADFQTAKGIVAVKNIEHEKGVFSVRLYLVAGGLSIQASETADGLDFEILPLGSGTVAEEK